jgi:hypothetical protein
MKIQISSIWFFVENFSGDGSKQNSSNIPAMSTPTKQELINKLKRLKKSELVALIRNDIPEAESVTVNEILRHLSYFKKSVIQDYVSNSNKTDELETRGTKLPIDELPPAPKAKCNAPVETPLTRPQTPGLRR